jgi:hypothetical protein
LSIRDRLALTGAADKNFSKRLFALLCDIGVSWEAAVAKIIERAPDYGQKQDALELCASWDRQTSDIKDLIEQIAEIIDPKHVHWTLRVAKTIGKGRPQGQLAAFLGDGILNAFWPAIHNEAPMEEVAAV